LYFAQSSFIVERGRFQEDLASKQFPLIELAFHLRAFHLELGHERRIVGVLVQQRLLWESIPLLFIEEICE
jgi:hypothetical protein